MTAPRHATVPTPVGPFTVLARDGVVCAAGFTDDVGRLAAMLGPGPAPRRAADLGAVTDAVLRYLDGEPAALDGVPVDQPGGPFTSEAWRAMRAVPAGTTVTYTRLAADAGRPDAVRAAAAACAGNRIALFVPCHRVLRLDGGLGGYLWGLHVKRWLLAHEAGGPQQPTLPLT
ncbi:methylated-DNA--[protein]-cysteine S-methyltransferase [Streptomyces capparidis]